MQKTELLDFVLDKVDDMKARDIEVLDVRTKNTVTDTLVICCGNSKTHVKSIAGHVAQESKNAGEPAIGVEGLEHGDWVLVDLGDVVVHVMTDESRDFYQLEKLWG